MDLIKKSFCILISVNVDSTDNLMASDLNLHEKFSENVYKNMSNIFTTMTTKAFGTVLRSVYATLTMILKS